MVVLYCYSVLCDCVVVSSVSCYSVSCVVVCSAVRLVVVCSAVSCVVVCSVVLYRVW